MTHTPYETLKSLSYEARLLEGISSLLDWDQETYMPIGAGEIRSEQLKQLAGMIHEKKTGAPFKKALEAVKEQELNPEERAAVKRWREDYLRAACLPTAFVKTLAKQHSTAIEAWRLAKESGSFKAFAPHLKKNS